MKRENELDIFVHIFWLCERKRAPTHICPTMTTLPTNISAQTCIIVSFMAKICAETKLFSSRENPFSYAETKSRKAIWKSVFLPPPVIHTLQLQNFTSHNEMQSRNTESRFIRLSTFCIGAIIDPHGHLNSDYFHLFNF